MEKSALIDSVVNYDWNFLNYPIHTVSAKPEQTSKEFAILLIHGFGASTDHWRFNIPILSTKYEVHAIDLLGFGKSPKPQDVRILRIFMERSGCGLCKRENKKTYNCGWKFIGWLCSISSRLRIK